MSYYHETTGLKNLMTLFFKGTIYVLQEIKKTTFYRQNVGKLLLSTYPQTGGGVGGTSTAAHLNCYLHTHLHHPIFYLLNFPQQKVLCQEVLVAFKPSNRIRRQEGF